MNAMRGGTGGIAGFLGGSIGPILGLSFATATIAYAGAGDILKQISNPGLAAQHAALANQTQATQAVQALRTATRTYQASNILGGGVMINVSNNPAAVPSQVMATIHSDGKIYVIDANGIIFGGSKQANTHELTGAAMGATSNSVTDLEKFQRTITKPKENPSLIKATVVGFGGK